MTSSIRPLLFFADSLVVTVELFLKPMDFKAHPDVIGFLAAQEYLAWYKTPRELAFVPKQFKDELAVHVYADVAHTSVSR